MIQDFFDILRMFVVTALIFAAIVTAAAWLFASGVL